MIEEANPVRLIAPALWLGALAPGLFIVAVVVQDLLRTDLDPMRSWVSHLAIGPVGWIQIVALVALGVALVIFGLGARPTLRTRRNAASTLIILLGTAAVMAGLFVSDPPAWPGEASTGPGGTVHGTVHDIAGAVLFISLAVVCFLTARAVSRPLGIAAGIIVVGGWITASTLVALEYGGVLSPAPSGFAERVALFAGLAWISALAITLLRRHGRRS